MTFRRNKLQTFNFVYNFVCNFVNCSRPTAQVTAQVMTQADSSSCLFCDFQVDKTKWTAQVSSARLGAVYKVTNKVINKIVYRKNGDSLF